MASKKHTQDSEINESLITQTIHVIHFPNSVARGLLLITIDILSKLK